jgi:hypothetical protein
LGVCTDGKWKPGCIYRSEMELLVYLHVGNGTPGVSTDQNWNAGCIYGCIYGPEMELRPEIKQTNAGVSTNSLISVDTVSANSLLPNLIGVTIGRLLCICPQPVCPALN